jgi:hypothetical protein
VNRFEFRSDQEEQPGAPGREVEMREPLKVVVIAVALVFFASTDVWSENPEISKEDINKLCEIYSRMPVTKILTIDHDRQPKIRPIVVHRCQKVIFKVDRGAASISITDTALSRANEDTLISEVGGVVKDTMVLWITAEGEGAAIRVPEDYPTPGKTVFVRYHTECYDPTAEEPYECQGTSPPMIIIPPGGP